MKTKFMASCAVITPDPSASWRLFVETLGLPLETSAGDDYAHSEHIDGVKHFGVWPLTQAAQACFGTRDRRPPAGAGRTDHRHFVYAVDARLT